MLRKRLLIRLGLLVLGFVSGAVVAIVLLQGVLADVESMNKDAKALVDNLQTATITMATMESRAAGVPLDTPATAEPDRGESKTDAERLRATIDALGASPVLNAPGSSGEQVLGKIRAALPSFFAEMGIEPATGGAVNPSTRHLAAVQLHGEVAELSRIARTHIADDQAALALRLRILIIGLAIAALVITNLAIVVLLRVATMILRPVAALIEGTRQLAGENFDYRVVVRQHDEFDELARSFNSAAQQLGVSEQNKVDALRQLSVTLNHEVNNAIHTIELQLHRLDRRVSGDPQTASYLSDIHQNLERVSKTIASLKDVRRVVLTSYLPGELMLDLPRSIAAEGAAPVS